MTSSPPRRLKLQPGECRSSYFVFYLTLCVGCSANKTLLDNKIKIDPPAQFAKLSQAQGESHTAGPEFNVEDEEGGEF